MVAGRSLPPIILLWAGVAAAQPADAPRLPPIEQCERAPGFAAARTAFANAVVRRDVAALETIAADDVQLDDEANLVGKAALRTTMTGELGADLWRQLQPIVAAGCALAGETATLPSFAATLSGEEMVIAAPSEPVRAGPSATARRIGVACWDRVAHNVGDSGPDYWHVRLASGSEGYVRAERVYSTASPYAVFERRAGRWKLIVLRLFPAD